MKIFNAFTDFKTFGGAELIAINLTKGLLTKGMDTNILSNTHKRLFNDKYDVKEINTFVYSYKLLSSLCSDDVIISHHRKVTTKLIILKKILFFKFRLIHVAHNEFFSLRFLTLYPMEIIAVSSKVKQNLISHFGISSERIKVIYNGITDIEVNKKEIVDYPKTKILLPARINKVKQQVEIVKNLAGYLNDNVEIHFAGIGDEIEVLKEITKNNIQFKVLGFVTISDIMQNYDYVMLYSKVEGLPTVLIEACMYGKPIICNDVGGNLEILDVNRNGFLADSYESLRQKLNSLPDRNSDEYKSLCFNSRQKYSSSFTFQKMIDNYINTILND